MQHHRAKARAAVDDDLSAAKKKLQSLSYGPKGQDPKKLFSHYDRDNSGHLDFNEFRNAVRRGGHLTPSMLSDGDLRKLFSAVDDDSSGDVSIDELTAFVWGTAGADTKQKSKKGAKREVPPRKPPKATEASRIGSAKRRDLSSAPEKGGSGAGVQHHRAKARAAVDDDMAAAKK